MNKLIIAVVAFVAFTGVARAADVTYTDVIKTCGAEWRESDAKKAVAKGEGVAAWNKYRVDCVARKGYVTKTARKNDFVRVPDKAN